MPPPNRVLLLAAGFSKNWNGWLATEVSDFLVQQPEVSPMVRAMLIRERASGFEVVLDRLQSNPGNDLVGLEVAIARAFTEMNQAYEQREFDFTNDAALSVKGFLASFDAIYTLNQDALLEIHYLSAAPELWSNGKFDGANVVGMRPDPNSHPLDRIKLCRPDSAVPTIPPRFQPYIKLHGSANWQSADGSRLLVIGGNKTSAIARQPLLQWGMRTFEDCLSKPDTLFMVIGYSFRDNHINQAILRAAEASGLTMFVVNPDGFEAVSWETRGGQIAARSDLYTRFEPFFGGVSTQPLSSTFGPSNRAEHRKLRSFLELP